MRDANMSGLFISQGEAIAPEPEFDRIAKRRPAEHFHLRTIAEAHFQ